MWITSPPYTPPLAWGGGPLVVCIPPPYLSGCQFLGHNPLNNEKKIFGKKWSVYTPPINCIIS
jgi:hypothetical protein